MTPVETMTDEELSRLALDLLEKELGVLGMLRFLRLTRVEAGGDYTRDRHKWQDGLTIDDILKESQDVYPQAAIEREAS